MCSRAFHGSFLTLLDNNIPLSGQALNCALTTAAHHGLDEIVASQLSAGASINSVDLRGHSALRAAINGNHTSTVSLLLKNGAALSEAPGEHLIFPATRKGNPAILGLMLKYGAETDTRGRRGQTPLHEAAYLGHVRIIILLVKHGADLHARNERRRTPLFEAARAGGVTVVEVLVRLSADVEAADADGDRPLSQAAFEGNKDVVALLIEKGADIEATNHRGFTALAMAAVYGKSEDAVTCLLKVGAKTLLKIGECRLSIHFDDANWAQDGDEDLEAEGLEELAAEDLRVCQLASQFISRVRHTSGLGSSNRTTEGQSWLDAKVG